jgi:hypothetical protein
MLMKKGYHKGQELTMSELGLSLEELAGQPLELFAREGARLLLTVALEEEVTDVLKRRPYESAARVTSAATTMVTGSVR